MFVLSSQGNAMYQVVATLVTLALVSWAVGFTTQTAGAANLVSLSDTLTDSDLGAVSNHTIQFTVPTTSNGIDLAGEEIVVSFPAGFDVSSINTNDVDLVVDGVEQTVATTTAAGTWGVNINGQDLELDTTDSFVSGGDIVVIEVGTNATAGAAGNDQVINNVGAGSYELDVTLPDDSATTHIVILDDVVVTASVATQFDFTVNGFAVTGVDANGTTTTGTSTATELGFGELSAGVIETLAQRLNVTTNAIGGFVVTVQQSQDLQSATGADIDGFSDGTYVNTPADWAAPGGGSPDIGDDDTWGHWALTSTDNVNTSEFQGCAGAATGCWVAASTTARDVFSHNGPADGITNNIGSSTVAYQVEITALQEAAEDYSTELTYIATPTF